MSKFNYIPFEQIHSELNELKDMVKQILTPKEDNSLKLYTIKESSLYLKCDEQTVKKHIRIGTLKASQLGGLIRIPHDQIFGDNNEVKSIKYKRKA